MRIKERHRKIAHVVNYYTAEGLKEKIEAAGFNLVRSKYLLNSYITNCCCKLGIRLGWQGILWFNLFPLKYLCLISDKLFGAKDGGYTLIVKAKKVSQIQFTKEQGAE